MTAIRTTHVGSLPRSEAVTEVLFAIEAGEEVSPERFETVVGQATIDVVARQREVGIDMPSDGEMSKISYATYIADRLTGFEGDSPRRAPADLKDFPSYLDKIAKAGGTPTYKRPRCTGPIEVKTLEPLHDDIRRFRAGLDAAGYETGFMNSASPGVIALFQPSDHHASHAAYLTDLADAMHHEYKAIVDAGLFLQIDAPDLALGRHMMFTDLTDDEFVDNARRHVDILNRALDGIDPSKVRMHVCWGNYEGPHTHDIPMSKILPTVLKAAPRTLLFEGANPRHAHEWQVWQEMDVPEGYTLVPGVLDTSSNYVEHPELVAERLERFSDIVGPAQLMAGSDCGFATFAGFGAVDAEIAWTKLKSLTEGTRLANQRRA
ncbi:MAG: cobalamin-independent methionine synthase II family protein [Pseudomonadota bacterium]